MKVGRFVLAELYSVKFGLRFFYIPCIIRDFITRHTFFSIYIDTAAVYKNEKDIGKSLKTLLAKYNLKRSDIFITSKLGKRYNCEKICKIFLSVDKK